MCSLKKLYCLLNYVLSRTIFIALLVSWQKIKVNKCNNCTSWNPWFWMPCKHHVSRNLNISFKRNTYHFTIVWFKDCRYIKLPEALTTGAMSAPASSNSSLPCCLSSFNCSGGKREKPRSTWVRKLSRCLLSSTAGFTNSEWHVPSKSKNTGACNTTTKEVWKLFNHRCLN